MLAHHLLQVGLVGGLGDEHSSSNMAKIPIFFSINSMVTTKSIPKSTKAHWMPSRLYSSCSSTNFTVQTFHFFLFISLIEHNTNLKNGSTRLRHQVHGQHQQKDDAHEAGEGELERQGRDFGRQGQVLGGGH